MYVCMYAHVVCPSVCLPWSVCGGQTATLAIGSHLLPFLLLCCILQASRPARFWVTVLCLPPNLPGKERHCRCTPMHLAFPPFMWAPGIDFMLPDLLRMTCALAG